MPDLPAAGGGRRRRCTERERLTSTSLGYRQSPWEPTHCRQLPCLCPDEHDDNAQCSICLENVEERGDVNILMLICGHWVCARDGCRPRRNRKWNQAIGREEEVDLVCPWCSTPLEPGDHTTMRRVRVRALYYPFCIARPSDSPGYHGFPPR